MKLNLKPVLICSVFLLSTEVRLAQAQVPTEPFTISSSAIQRFSVEAYPLKSTSQLEEEALRSLSAQARERCQNGTVYSTRNPDIIRHSVAMGAFGSENTESITLERVLSCSPPTNGPWEHKTQLSRNVRLTLKSAPARDLKLALSKFTEAQGQLYIKDLTCFHGIEGNWNLTTECHFVKNSEPLQAIVIKDVRSVGGNQLLQDQGAQRIFQALISTYEFTDPNWQYKSKLKTVDSLRCTRQDSCILSTR